MRKRKFVKLKSISTISITAIITLGLIGIGYGMWNDGLHIDINLKTGNVNFDTIIEESVLGDLRIDVVDDGHRIVIGGTVHPGFNKDIDIVIKDTGTVPLVLDRIEEEVNASEIVKLIQKDEDSFKLNSIFRSDEIGTFNLQIWIPEDIDDNEVDFLNLGRNMDSQEEDMIQREINRISEEILELECELERLDKKVYDFKYKLHFIQGI